MADYKIQVGTELKTDGINSTLKNYKGKVNVNATLNTDDITKKLSKAKKINVEANLITKGITEKIGTYKPAKKIRLESDLSTAGITKKIREYKFSKPIRVDVELTKSSINQQIRDTHPTERIRIGAELDDDAIGIAIRKYKAPALIKVMVDPDFTEAASKISNYQMRNLLKVNVKLNKTFIDSQIKNFQTSQKIQVGAQLKDNAIEKAIKSYSGKELVPITVDFMVGDSKEITNKITEYKKTPVVIPVKLRPAQNDFDSAITKKPVKVQATLDPENIDSSINNFTPKSKVKVDVELKPTDINGQIRKLQKPTELIPVGAKLDDKSINTAITTITPTSRIGVGVDLKTEDINQQVENIHPTAKIKVGIDLSEENIKAETEKQQGHAPVEVNVRLNTEKINEQIRDFKTQSKIKVGVKLDFASHKDGQVGIPQQIKDYKTNAKIKVGVQLDKDDINSVIQNTKSDVPMKLGVELDLEPAKAEIERLRAEFQKFGKIVIQFPNANAGSGSGVSGNNVSGGISGNNAPSSNVIGSFDKFTASVTNAKNVVSAMKTQLKGLGVNLKDTQAKTITKDISEMGIEVQKVVTTINGTKLKMSITGIQETEDGIQRIVELSKEYEKVISNPENINKSFTQKFETSLDRQKQEAKEVNAAYREMKSLVTKIKNTSIDINKTSAAGEDVDALEQKLATLIGRYDELDAKVNGKLNDGQVRNLSNAWDDFSNSVDIADEKLANAAKRKASLDAQRQEIKDTNAAYREMKSLIKEIGITRIKINGLKESGQDCDALEQKFDALVDRYNELNVKYSHGFDKNQTRNINNEWQNITHNANIAREAIERANTEAAKDIKSKNFANYNAEITRLETGIRGLVNPTDEVRNGLDRVKQAFADMQSASNNKELLEAENRYQRELEETKALLSERQSLENREGGTGEEIFGIKKEAALIRISNLFEDGSQAAKRFGARARELTQELNNVGSVDGINKVNNQIANLEKQIKKSNLQTKTFSTRLKDQFSKYSQYLSIASVFMYATQALKDMFEQVKLIDSAMTELKKVTDESDASYNQFLSNAAERAKVIGTSIDGLVQSTAEFAKIGYSFEDSQGLAEVANIYKVVGDNIESAEVATESLISTMAAFKGEMNGMSNTDFAMSIVDKFNEVSNKYSIGSGGLGEALTRSASSMAAANNTLDETIALITAANEVVNLCHAA